MSVCLVSGAAGLIGSEAVSFFGSKGFHVVGIDNDMRSYFFGRDASTDDNLRELKGQVSGYQHHTLDIRDYDALSALFKRFGSRIELVIHAAAQPSHDWAAREPFTDFGINATGTLNMLEACRTFCPEAVFIFTSTNKVYGDRPNKLPLVELAARWEISPSHPYFRNGIDEGMSIDQSKHSIFGASKVAADVMVQEYGRYFDMRCGVFRGGCLTGPRHAGTEAHGFLAYLMKCAVTGKAYQVYGYKGKQVRDNIHSLDLVEAFMHFFEQPRCGEVYNMGGSRFSNCSLLEAVSMCEEIAGREMKIIYREANRNGDHIWWISDISRFTAHYPDWSVTRDVPAILKEIHTANAERWAREAESSLAAR